MNKLFFIFIFNFFSVDIYCQLKFNLRVESKINLNGQKIYLEIYNYEYGKMTSTQDSATFEKNWIQFSGILTSPCEDALLHLKNFDNRMYFVLDSGFNYIKILPLTKKSLWKRNNLSEHVFLNSKSNDLKNKLDSLDNILYQKFGNNLSLRPEEVSTYRNYQLKLLENNISNYYTLKKIYDFSNKKNSSNGTIRLLEIFNRLDSNIKISNLGLKVLSKLNNSLKLNYGKVIPKFSLLNTKDKIFTNDSLENKVYLLAFGAVWCGPCKKNIPSLKKIYSKYKDKGLEILYVNLDDDKKKWESMIKEYSMNWINLSTDAKFSESQITKDYDIKFLPCYLIVDRDKKIVYNSLFKSDDDLFIMEETILNVSK